MEPKETCPRCEGKLKRARLYGKTYPLFCANCSTDFSQSEPLAQCNMPGFNVQKERKKN